MMFQVHLIFCLPSPRISFFPRGPGSFYQRMVLEAKILVFIPTGVLLSLSVFSGPRIYLEYIYWTQKYRKELKRPFG